MQSGREDTLKERYAIKLCFKLWKNATETYGMLQTVFGPSCINQTSVIEWHKRFKEGREYVRDDEKCGRRRKSVNQSWLVKGLGLGLGLLYWGFKGVQEEIPSNRVSDISTRTISSMPQTIWARWASRQFLSLPVVQNLLPVTFGYSLNSEAVVMRQLRRWKRLWNRSLTHSHKRTSMGPSRSCWNSTTSTLQPEEITSKGKRVSCVYCQ